LRTISTIILNYNTSSESIKLYKKLVSFELDFLSIKIIDNSSSPADKKKLTAQIPREDLLLNSFNLGYAAGNEVGVREAIKNNCKIVLLLNPDISISKTSFLNLYKTFIGNTNCQILGPRICDSLKRTEIYSDGGIILEHEGYLTTHLNNSKLIHEVKNPGLHRVDYVNGSCMMFSTELIDKVGFMRNDFFMYYEETEWCLRIRDHGYSCWVDSNICVYHSTSSKNSRYHYYMTRNRILLARIRKQHLTNTLKRICFPVVNDIWRRATLWRKPSNISKVKIKAILNSFKRFKNE
jgi:GT2 family glycosyltransferase